jgi:hypothetical protein
MEGYSTQLHVPAALSPEKGHGYSLGRRLGGTQCQSERCEQDKNFRPYRESKPCSAIFQLAGTGSPHGLIQPGILHSEDPSIKPSRNSYDPNFIIFAINLPTYAQYFHHFIIYLHSPTRFGPLWTIIRALQVTKFTD